MKLWLSTLIASKKSRPHKKSLPDKSHSHSKPTLKTLWYEFLPLSLSDLMMAFGDPLVTVTAAHLPDARVNLAAIGIIKPVAVFFESPIIMILHASNTLCSSKKALRALKQFVLLSICILSFILLFLSIPSVFKVFGGKVLAIPEEMMHQAHIVLFLMILWPAASAWRRFHQGILIHNGFNKDVASASVGRFLCGGLILLVGFIYGVKGYLLGALALIGKIGFEAIAITIMSKMRAPHFEVDANTKHLPDSIGKVWRFYWPLANSMVLVWGARACLIALIARSYDSSISLAAWPAASGLVLLMANSTRMVQQVIIRNRKKVAQKLLLQFALSVGFFCSLILAFFSIPPWEKKLIDIFIGMDPALSSAIHTALLICIPIPLLVAIQNALQAFLIGDGRTSNVNKAALTGSAMLLLSTAIGLELKGSGTAVAATAMVVALVTENIWLLKEVKPVFSTVTNRSTLSLKA